MTATIQRAYIIPDPDRSKGKLVIMHTGEAVQETQIDASEAEQIEPKELIGLTLYAARTEIARQRNAIYQKAA